MPLLKNWPKRDIPTTNEIKDWFKKWPDCNMGVVLGSAVSLVAIDVDGAGGEELLAQLSAGDLPDTWEYTTPGGGRRLMYLLPPHANAFPHRFSIPNAQHEECALMGDGQQIVLPPSIHPTGGQYQWRKGHGASDIELATAPKWLLWHMSTKDKKPLLSQELSPLLNHCLVFAQDSARQRDLGLCEERWFLWCSLLVNAGKDSAALAFSMLSGKHDERSEDRLEKLKDSPTGLVRCATFGCDVQQIKACHGDLRLNESGHPTNSPGVFLNSAVRANKEAIHVWPTSPLYEPYMRVLKETPYRLNEKGELSYESEKKAFPIANFVARVTKESVRDDGVVTEQIFAIEGVLAGGERLPPITVPSTIFDRMSWLISKWGMRPLVYPGIYTKDYLRVAIQSFARDAIRETIYTHLGWREVNDKWVFLYYDGCIGADDVTVDVDKVLSRYSLSDQGYDLADAARASLALLDVAPLDVTIPLLALTYLSPLCEPLRQAKKEPNFLVWLHGTTGSRKTSLSMLFLSHFGNFVRDNPPASFRDTANALEKRTSLTKDCLIIVDDYHPSSSQAEAKQLEDKAQKLLRSFGDRVARGRLTSTTDFRPEYVPRGLALITGEDQISGQSSNARCLGIEINKNSVDLNLLSQAQNNAPLLPQVMRGYIEWLCPKMPHIANDLSALFLENRKVFQKETAHGRLGEAAAWLKLGWDTMLEYMLNLGVISIEKSSELSQVAEEVLLRLAETQSAHVTEETPAVRFIAALSNMLVCGEISSSPDVNPAKRGYLYHNRNTFIGWEDSAMYYFQPNYLYAAVESHLSRQRNSLNIKPNTLWAQLDALGMLVTEQSAGRTQRLPKKNLPGEKNVRPRMLHIPKPRLLPDGMQF